MTPELDPEFTDSYDTTLDTLRSGALLNRIERDEAVRTFLAVDPEPTWTGPRPTPPTPTFSIVRRSRVNGRWVYSR